ncbi:MAG TPA: glycosyltransferase family 2 protein [Terracidiphilus sp.]|nr:glycosyltransferase family 2 protein [Terracidiphilus sp.]
MFPSASRPTAIVAGPSGAAVPVSVTVCVCTRNRPDLLRACLAGVTRMSPAADEILVVDNSSGDAAIKQIALEFGARYVLEPKPGLSRARNMAVAESASDVVAFLDDDAVPDEKWLESLLQPFADARVSTVTGRIVTPESPILGPDQRAPRTLTNRDLRWFEAACFGGLGLGSNMALRKSTCKGLTIFDVRLGRGAPFQIAEENYAFARLLSLGHTAVHVPAAVVYHPPFHRASIEQEARNSITYWLLLFSQFPGHRMDLLRFLLRRLRKQKLSWPRDSQDPGDIISSSWQVTIKAATTGLILFLRSRKGR